MKRFLFVLLMCISGLAYAQSDTTDYEDWRFYYRVRSLSYEYVSIDELHDDDNFRKKKRFTYKPFIDIYLLDTINKFRIKNGHKPLLYDTSTLDAYFFDRQIMYTQEYAKAINDEVYLIKDEDPNPECDCVSSIMGILLDDSLTMTTRNLFTGKEKVRTFKDIILSDKWQLP